MTALGLLWPRTSNNTINFQLEMSSCSAVKRQNNHPAQSITGKASVVLQWDGSECEYCPIFRQTVCLLSQRDLSTGYRWEEEGIQKRGAFSRAPPARYNENNPSPSTQASLIGKRRFLFTTEAELVSGECEKLSSSSFAESIFGKHNVDALKLISRSS